MLGLFVETKCPQMTCELDVVWHLQKPSCSKHGPPLPPSPVPSACNSLHVTSRRVNMVSYCRTIKEGSFAFSPNDPLVIWAGGQKWNPQACPRSVSSASLVTESVSLNILPWSAPLYVQLRQSGVRKFGFHLWVLKSGSLVHDSQCCLAQEMKRRLTNI